MKGTFGPTWPKRFASFDPDESCWRMFAGMSARDLTRLSKTWPKRGSMRSGACFEHPTWVPAISVPVCSSLLRTPDVASGRRLGEVKLTGRTPQDPQVSLHDQINALLPTPVVNDMGEGKTEERWDEWTAEMQERHGNGNGHGRSLAIEAARIVTRRSRGASTNPPSDDGSTSSDDPPPRLPTTPAA